MGLIRTILWALLAVGILALAVLQTQEGSLARLFGRGEFKEGQFLFSYEPEQAHLIIARVGEKSLSFVKNDKGEWWCQTPWQDRMDPRAAAAIIQFSLGMKIVDTLPLNHTVTSNMREFGVDNTPVEVIIKDKKESSLARFKLGSLAPWVIRSEDEKTPPLPTLYLKTDYYKWNDDIFVVTGNINPLFKEGMKYLRDYRPLYFDVKKLSAIEIKTPIESFFLEKDAITHKWKLGANGFFDADEKMVQNFLSVIQALSATELLEEKEVVLSEKLQQNAHTVTLAFEGGNPLVLTLYPSGQKEQKTVLAKVSNRKGYFSLPIVAPDKGQAGLSNLAMSSKILRSRQLLPVERKEIEGISLRFGESGEGLVIKKSLHDKWVYQQRDGSILPVNEYQLYSFLKTLLLEPVADFATDAVVDVEPYGLYNPLGVITFALKDKSPLSLVIGKGVDEGYYAQLENSPTVYALSSDYVSALGLATHRWRSPLILQLNSCELKNIQLERKDAPRMLLEYDFAGESWVAKEGAKGEEKNVTLELNPHKANNLLTALEKLEVLQWMPSSFDSAYQALKKPTHTLVIETEPTVPIPGLERVSQTLFFAPASRVSVGADPLYFGQVEGDGDYFLIPESKVKDIFFNLKETHEDDR